MVKVDITSNGYIQVKILNEAGTVAEVKFKSVEKVTESDFRPVKIPIGTTRPEIYSQKARQV